MTAALGISAVAVVGPRLGHRSTASRPCVIRHIVSESPMSSSASRRATDVEGIARVGYIAPRKVTSCMSQAALPPSEAVAA
jgi:hypothetical protein